MKIEIGESLFLSWLKHVKECKIVQMNWKASSQWELEDKERLTELMETSRAHFAELFDYNIYKGTTRVEQLIAQGEVDVIGVNFDDEEEHIYAIDVAFHGAGLNYGARKETVERVIKKIMRTAMCLYGYFGTSKATIIFASPKINNSVEEDLKESLKEIPIIFQQFGLEYEARVIGNEEFDEKILQPTLNVLDEVEDTSELFMRSLKMYNLFAKGKATSGRRRSTSRETAADLKSEEIIEAKGLEGLEEMKIGVIARTVLRRMLEEGKASKEEIEKMQTKEYTKETFDLQYPLLLKATDTTEEKTAEILCQTTEDLWRGFFSSAQNGSRCRRIMTGRTC